MAKNNVSYTLSEIFRFEALTCKYSVAKGTESLDAKTLINLGLLDDNYDYARYIQFKHNLQLEEMIDKKVSSLGYVFSKNVINDPEYFLEYKGDHYEKIYRYYKGLIVESNVPKIEQIINLVIRDNNLKVLYYIYFKEEDKISRYLARREDEINNGTKSRKFFIIQ